MAVFRVNKSTDYTVMSNYHLRDRTLSLKAIGLLSKILSLPDEWDYSISGLVSICKESRRPVEGALSELKEHGYLVVDKMLPNETESGRFEYVYNIYEEPVDVKKQDPQKQGVEKQGVEKQGLVSGQQLNTNTLNTKESNTKKSKATVQDVLEMIPEELRETAEAFVEHRKKLKAPMTGHALELAIKKAKKYANDDLDTTIAIMEQSIENGWKGIFELKDKKKERGWMNDVQRMDDDCSGSMFDIYE